MRTIIALRDLDGLSSTEELQSYMYNPGISFSYAKTNKELQRSDYYSVTWDRRSDCAEWYNVKGIGHTYTYIDFEIYREYNRLPKSGINSGFIGTSMEKGYSKFIIVDIDPKAYSVDFRAYARAIYYISKTNDSIICEGDNSEFLSNNDYYCKYHEIIDKKFEIEP